MSYYLNTQCTKMSKYSVGLVASHLSHFDNWKMLLNSRYHIYLLETIQMERSNQQYTIYTLLPYCNTLLFVTAGSTAYILSRRNIYIYIYIYISRNSFHIVPTDTTIAIILQHFPTPHQVSLRNNVEDSTPPELNDATSIHYGWFASNEFYDGTNS